MKPVVLLTALLLIFGQAFTQRKDIRTFTNIHHLSQREMDSAASGIYQSFQAAIQNTRNCVYTSSQRSRFCARTFGKDAAIQTMNPGSKQVHSWKPIEYFNWLNSLYCGPTPRYDSARYTFNVVSYKAGLNEMGVCCKAVYKVSQSVRNYNDDHLKYADSTLKTIIIRYNFSPAENGSYEVKIDSVRADNSFLLKR